MLPPEYLLSCGDDIMSMYENLNIAITKDIARRIMKTGEITKSAVWQAKIVQESGMLMEDIIREVSSATTFTQAEIESMFIEAGVAAVRYDAMPLIKAGIAAETGLSPSMLNVLRANLIKTKGNLNNLVMTTASAGQQSFLDIMNQAVMMVESGAFDYQTVLRRVIEQASRIGAKVNYDNGGSISLEAAARMNLMTSLNQTASKISIMNGERLGAEYYETSAHVGARPTHQEWQGKVFKIEGSTAEYDNFYDATGYGEVDGLCGANCRHSFYPFFPGISEPAYSEEKLKEYENNTVTYNGVQYNDYEASQIQRRYERAIRESKRTVAALKESVQEAGNKETAAMLKEELARVKKTYKARRDRLTEFCNQTGRQKESIRHKTAIVSAKEVKAIKEDFGDKPSIFSFKSRAG